MRFSTFLAALLPASAVLAENIIVKVGDAGGLTYTPNTVTAKDGDTIEFQFLSKNHTVTQSTFAAPCSNMTDGNGAVIGVDSGYQMVPPDAKDFPSWKITIKNASAPLWFFCRQGTHCKAGMVLAVNPTADKTFDAFKAKAANAVSTNGAADPNTPGAAPPTGPGAPPANAPPTTPGTAPVTPSPNTQNQTQTPDVTPAPGSARAMGVSAGVVTFVALALGSML